MNADTTTLDRFEISARFRQTIEGRIARLEQDAVTDEWTLRSLTDVDHIRRHLRLISVQRAEALRMRLFLDRAGTRKSRPFLSS